MGIDELKERFERLLGEYTRPVDAREQSHALHSALVDLKTGLKDLHAALAATHREVETEREQLATAERRGREASEIGDAETAEVAGQFIARHQERLEVLDRKLAAQRDEIAIAERDYAELAERYRTARQGPPVDRSVQSAAVELDDDDLLRATTDRRSAESVVNAQLDALKKKLGK
jgi:hypothetical protein